MTSEVWNYFTKNESEEIANCNKCTKPISCKGNSTSGMIRHLSGKHQIHLTKRAASSLQQVCFD